MFDDQSPPPFEEIVDDDDIDKQSSPLRNCLFLSITLVLVVLLAGSSVLTYFLVTTLDREDAVIPGPAPTIETLPQSILDQTKPDVIVNTPVAAGSLSSSTEIAGQQVIDRIVMINRQGQVETISPSGDDRRTLTSLDDNRIYQFPAWAPDGKNLAVIGSGRIGSGIYLLEDRVTAGRSTSEEIYFSPNNAPIYLYWSPDSTNLGFLANQSRSAMGLNVVSRDGNNRVVATGSPFYWDWSDDGRQMLIHSGQRASADRLAYIDVDGNTQVDDLARPGYFQAPGISASGRYWAFGEQSGLALSSLALIDTTTGERQQYEQAGSLALSWSPTQDLIAYTAGTVDGHPLWGSLNLLDVATGQKRVLSQQTVIAFFWSPDGRSIAFLTLNRSRQDDDVIAGAAPKTRQLSRTSSLVQQPERDFLSLSVIDVESGRGLRLLDFTPTPIFVAQFLPYFDQYALSHRIWSPDGRSLVLPVRENGLNVILVIPIDSGRPQRLAEGDIAFWSHR